MEKSVLTVEEIGTMLNLSRSKAYELIHSKNAPPVIRVGRVFRVPVDGFKAWLTKQSEQWARL